VGPSRSLEGTKFEIRTLKAQFERYFKLLKINKMGWSILAGRAGMTTILFGIMNVMAVVWAICHTLLFAKRGISTNSILLIEFNLLKVSE